MAVRIKVSKTVMVWVLVTGGLGLWRTWQTGMAGLWGILWPWLTVGGAAALHELGHLAAARWAGAEVRGLRLDLFGARMELGGLISYSREAAIALGGPAANLLTAAAALPLWRMRGGREDALLLFWTASLILCAVNLLPVRTLDGGRVLYCAAARLLGVEAAEAAVGVTTALCLGGLWLWAAYALLRSAQLLSLFVFSLCLLLLSLGRR